MRCFHLAIVALSFMLGGCSWMGNWFQGGEDNSAPAAALVSFTPSLAVETVWSTRVGVGSNKQFVKLVPAVALDRVYAADRKGRVVAVDAASGRPVWNAKTDMRVSAGPGVGEGLVLVGTSDGEVLALDSADGTLKWRASVSSEVLSVPQVLDGVVVVATMDGKVFGLEAADGKQRWVYDRTVPVLALRGASSPVLTHGRAIGGFASGKLASLDLRDGRPQWEATIAVPRGRSELERLVDISADPILVGDVVFVVSFQGRIAAVSVDSGRVIWARDFSSYTGLTTDGNQLYVVDDQSHVWALYARNGASAWKQDKFQLRSLTAPTVHDDAVVVGDFEGYLHWLSREDGELLARSRVDSEGIGAAPVAVDDTLYVLGNSGILKALKTRRK